jgi:hypothetical protein
MAWWKRNHVQLSPELHERARVQASAAGYSSLQEFVEHCVNKELDGGQPVDDEVLRTRLRGLGYVE